MRNFPGFGIKTVEMKLARVERVTKAYDDQGRIIEESWEYYYPSDDEGRGKVVGFKEKK